MNAIYESMLNSLHDIASGQSGAAIARSNLRETVPTLFPAAPTVKEIHEVVNSDDWGTFDHRARVLFAKAWTEAPRMVKFGDTVDENGKEVATEYTPNADDFGLWSADKKTAKSYDIRQTAIRKAIQAYVRVSIKQNVTDFIPDASDAPAETPAETPLPDPAAILALVDGALVILSERDNAKALVLLNGLDALVKSARPVLSSGGVLKAKA